MKIYPPLMVLAGITMICACSSPIGPIAGGALEFASGYEGIGAGAAGGGTQVLFKIVSQGTR